MADTFIVYKITNTTNGKLYIGITQSPLAKRWSSHRSSAHHGAGHPLYHSMRKYGDQSFGISVAYEATSVAEMFAVERGLIAQYGILNRDLGYNLSPGGEYGPGRVFCGTDNARSKVTDEIVRFIRDPAESHIVNDDMRCLAEEQFGILTSRDCIRDARRGDTWTHLNKECPPIKVGQGTRTSERKSRSAATNLINARKIALPALALRLRHQKIAAKLNTDQVRAIYLDPRRQAVIDRAYSVSHGTARRIKSRLSYADVTQEL